MKKSVYILISILLISCSSTDDSEVNNCVSDCTTIKGRITTDNSVGISGVEVEFIFVDQPVPGFGAFIRNIAKGKTDEDGNFEISGYIKDEEIYNFEDGSFKIRILEESLDDSYIKKEELVSEFGFFSAVSAVNVDKFIPMLSTRDTIIEHNLIVPRKELLTVRVRNFEPEVEIDRIEIDNSIKTSQMQSTSFYVINNFITSDFGEINFDIQIVGALNFLNELRISKRKNGLIEYETIEVMVTEQNNNEVTIFY